MWAIICNYDSLMLYQGDRPWVASKVLHISTGIEGIESQRMSLIRLIVGSLYSAEWLPPDIKEVPQGIGAVGWGVYVNNIISLKHM